MASEFHFTLQGKMEWKSIPFGSSRVFRNAGFCGMLHDTHIWSVHLKCPFRVAPVCSSWQSGRGSWAAAELVFSMVEPLTDVPFMASWPHFCNLVQFCVWTEFFDFGYLKSSWITSLHLMFLQNHILTLVLPLTNLKSDKDLMCQFL